MHYWVQCEKKPSGRTPGHSRRHSCGIPSPHADFVKHQLHRVRCGENFMSKPWSRSQFGAALPSGVPLTHKIFSGFRREHLPLNINTLSLLKNKAVERLRALSLALLQLMKLRFSDENEWKTQPYITEVEIGPIFGFRDEESSAFHQPQRDGNRAAHQKALECVEILILHLLGILKDHQQIFQADDAPLQDLTSGKPQQLLLTQRQEDKRCALGTVIYKVRYQQRVQLGSRSCAVGYNQFLSSAATAADSVTLDQLGCCLERFLLNMSSSNGFDLGLLIELVSSHSHLYDVKNKNYKNNKMKDNTWEAIVLETTPDDCKRLWKNLRDRFTKEKRSRSGESAKESEWQYFKRMLFYDKHCTPRRTITATPCYSSGLHQTNEGGDNESSQSSSSYKSWTSTDGALSPEPGTTQENEDIQEFTTQENEDSQQFSGSQPLHSSAMSPSVQVVSGERAKRLRPAVQTALLTTPGKKRQKVENKEIGGMVQIAKQIIVSVLRLKMSEDAEFVSSDVEESAALAVNELLPVKSRKKYDKAYQQFEDWCREKRKTQRLDIMEIEKFLREADNGTYLMMKVMLIIGISGACRREELTFLDVKNITDKGPYIIIQIPDTKTNVRREFTISLGNFEAETFGKFWITNIHSAGSVEEDRIIGLPGLQI
ncbi:hypothetical protein GEV33_013430 [Tenebrio molitor]|uniref:MADF domain-containing protein n=1 Tax=Tenebrio molitor TaxID=7067 RepID=A0A8J6LDR3_TENMO|nr:hypothetical protein GEV33_013430 [Tenebrio molitor]